MTESPEDEYRASPLRPYILTGGKTRTAGPELDIETILTGTHSAPATQSLTSEQRRILERCREPCSIAELASHLDLPLGVARYLASEMVSKGALRPHQTTSHEDDALIERLIRGIQAI